MKSRHENHDGSAFELLKKKTLLEKKGQRPSLRSDT
jgi:hypothetical protein